MRWAGVDVGGRRKGFDVAIIEAPDQLTYLGRVGSVALVTELLREQKADLVAVDSPYRPAPDGASSREGERLLARRVCNIRYTPDKAGLDQNPRYYEWIFHGFELYASLEDAGLDVIECFPTATWTRFLGPRGSEGRAAWSTRSLARTQIKSLPVRLSQDSRDAVGAALTARAATEEAIERFGDIVVPLALVVDGAGPPTTVTREFDRPALLEFSELHPAIITACVDHFANGAYADAVEKGFRVVRERLRELTGHERGSDAFGRSRLHVRGAVNEYVDHDFNEGVRSSCRAQHGARTASGHVSVALAQAASAGHRLASLGYSDSSGPNR